MPKVDALFQEFDIVACARYTDVMIPSVHFPVTFLFMGKVPVDFEVTMHHITQAFREDQILERKLRSDLAARPYEPLSSERLRTFKWATRIIKDDDSAALLHIVFVVAKDFSDSALHELLMYHRRDALIDEPWISRGAVLPNGVVCAGCGKWVHFDGGRHYDLLVWVTHRDSCEGIEARMIQAVLQEWEDAIDDEELEATEPSFEAPDHAVLEPSQWPLRYPTIPRHARWIRESVSADELTFSDDYQHKLDATYNHSKPLLDDQLTLVDKDCAKQLALWGIAEGDSNPEDAESNTAVNEHGLSADLNNVTLVALRT